MKGDPFSILLGLEQQARRLATSFPRTKKANVLYTGIGFEISSHLAVVCVEDVCEVIPYPRVTPIPNVRGWIHGLAAIRGELLPIVHLSLAVGGPSGGLSRKAKILTVRYLGSMVGLLVDEVFGIKRFATGEREDSRQEKKEWLSPYLEGAFIQEEKVWNIFSIAALEKNGVLSRVSQ